MADGTPFETRCECGHKAVEHWHGKRHKRVILSAVQDCSKCGCTVFREPVNTPFGRPSPSVSASGDRP